MKDARIDLRIPHKTKTRWQKEADKRFGPNSLSRMIVMYVDRQLDQETAQVAEPKQPALT